MNDCFVKELCKKYSRDKSCDDSNFCIKLFKLEELYDQALLSKSQRKRVGLVLDSDLSDQQAFEQLSKIETNILDFVNEGKNLFIYSNNVGNGKTSWSIRMIQSYLNKIWPESNLSCRALFVNVPRFLLTLKDSISNSSDYINHIKQYVLDVDLVVWDEIGVKSLTTYEHEHLLNLINTRIDKNKSNIYTSNLFGNELQEKVGERLYSRITNLSTNIELVGQDKRGIVQ